MSNMKITKKLMKIVAALSIEQVNRLLSPGAALTKLVDDLIKKNGLENTKRDMPELTEYFDNIYPQKTRSHLEDDGENYPIGSVFIGQTGPARKWVATAIKLVGVTDNNFIFEQLEIKVNNDYTAMDGSMMGVPSNKVLKKFSMKKSDVNWEKNNRIFSFSRKIKGIGERFYRWDGNEFEMYYKYYY